MYILIRDDRYVPGRKWEVEKVKDESVQIYGAKYFSSVDEAFKLAEKLNNKEMRKAGMVKEYALLNLKINAWEIDFCSKKEFIKKMRQMGFHGDTVQKLEKYIETHNLPYSIRENIH